MKPLATRWRRAHQRAFWGAALSLCLCLSAHAEPWLAPGDMQLRQDLELLVDVGAINLPLTTWPISWGAVARAMQDTSLPLDSPASWQRAFYRVDKRARQETSWGYARGHLAIGAADNPMRLRGFEYTPRANGEISAGLSYTGTMISGRVNATVAFNPADDRNIRFDGSYVGVALGNTTINFGLQDKWWGPGWDGALALSNNARPIPGVLIQRNFSDPFESPWLSWIGPWTASFFLGQLESGRAVPSTRFVGARVAFRPFRALEIGLTRTAQWGGDGRPDDLDSFFDLVLGRDNVGDDGIGRDEEPGNQLAGYDWRWRVKQGRWPVVFYGQFIGEDEAGGFPSRFLGQLGLSTTIAVRQSHTLALRAEYADATCQFYESSKIFNCAYRNSLYPTGYNYRERAIGYAADSDSRQLSVAASLTLTNGHRYSATVRAAELNRGGAPDSAHTLSTGPADLTSIDLAHEREIGGYAVTFGIGLDRADSPAGSLNGNDFRALFQIKKSI